ncbi:hypothetical protein ACIQ1J_00220 [Streptomyces sp. NPDC097107]|uniref:hypothetical protein n=1 Tax=Streptomyces sp. NPDC097107 TaxID=3366089 RepID=UPI0037F8441D
MDVFGVHHDLIAEYEAFTSSLVAVRDPDIENHLAGERERKTRWPDPKLALNPTFRSGGTVASLCDDGLLHPMCREYFRITSVSAYDPHGFEPDLAVTADRRGVGRGGVDAPRSVLPGASGGVRAGARAGDSTSRGRRARIHSSPAHSVHAREKRRSGGDQ